MTSEECRVRDCCTVNELCLYTPCVCACACVRVCVCVSVKFGFMGWACKLSTILLSYYYTYIIFMALPEIEKKNRELKNW